MDEGSLSSLAVLLLLLMSNMFLALGHNALINASSTHLRQLADQGKKRAALAEALGEDATALLWAYQLSVIVVRFLSAGIAAVGLAPPFAGWLAGLGLAGGTASLLAEVIVLLSGAGVMFTFGGQIPTAIGTAYADRLAPLVAPAMQLVVSALRPVLWLLRTISEGMLRLLRVESLVRFVTEEEIKTLVDAGQEGGMIENEEKEMIYSIFQLGDTSVREVMVPRLDVVSLKLDTPLDEAVQTVLAAGHSRIPVYEDNIDHVRGLLYAKDLLKMWGEGGNGDALKDLLRPTYFVPEGKSAMALLQEMQQKRVHLAVVIDEYGGMAGLVTLEDLIEEIIGEVQDEYDFNEQAAYTRVSDDEYICQALLDLDDLNNLMDLSLPTDESDTLGGFIFARVGEVPQPGHVLETAQVRLEVLTVNRRRIGQVRVTRLDPDALDEDGAGDS